MAEDHTDEAIPIKKVRKKLSKKKALTIITAVLLTLAAVFVFVTVNPAVVDYKSSEIYSKKDIRNAVKCVKKDFKSLHGCILCSLSYAGDEQVELEKKSPHDTERQYEEYILIDSVFLSPLDGGDSWNPAETYHWSWVLGRKSGGDWEVITRGVG